jgi:hypothetical protein
MTPVDAASATTGSSLLASQLIRRDVPPRDDAELSVGHRLLLQHGFVVDLAPGLVSGLTLFERCLSRVEAHCRAALAHLSAQELSLPASEGEALINLLLHSGAATRTDRVVGFSVGAGFRHDGLPPRGLYDMSLYQRLDVAVVSDADDRPDELLGSSAEAMLSAIELPIARREGESDEFELVATIGEREEVVGRVRGGAVGDTGRRVACLALDLSALVAVLADLHADDHGLVWPHSVAPCDLGLLVVDQESSVALGLCEKLRVELVAGGFDVLLDDRPLDAALRRSALQAWGLPLRVMLGPSAEQGEVLLEQRRNSGPPERVPATRLLARVAELLERDIVHGTRRGLRRRANF